MEGDSDTCYNIEDIMLSEISQTQNTLWFHLYEVSSIVKFMESESGIVISRQWREGMGSYYLIDMEF